MLYERHNLKYCALHSILSDLNRSTFGEHDRDSNGATDRWNEVSVSSDKNETAAEESDRKRCVGLCDVFSDPFAEIVSRNEPLGTARNGFSVDEQSDQRDAPHVKSLDERRIVAGVY